MKKNKQERFLDFQDPTDSHLLEVAIQKEEKQDNDVDLIGHFLKQIPLFYQFSKMLPLHLMKRLYYSLKIREFDKGEFIYRQGDQDDYLYIVLRGKVFSYEKCQESDKSEENTLQDDAILMNYLTEIKWQNAQNNKAEQENKVKDKERQKDVEINARQIIYQQIWIEEFKQLRDDKLDEQAHELIRQRAKAYQERCRLQEQYEKAKQAILDKQKIKKKDSNTVANSQNNSKMLFENKQKQISSFIKKPSDFIFGSIIMIKRYQWKKREQRKKKKTLVDDLQSDCSSSMGDNGAQQTLSRTSSFLIDSTSCLGSVKPSKIRDKLQIPEAQKSPADEIAEEQELDQAFDNQEELLGMQRVGEGWSVGQCFGEEALLITVNERQQFNVSGSNYLKLAALSRRAFKEVLFEFYLIELHSEIEFLKSCNLFANFSDKELEQILLKLEKLKCENDFVIFKEGDKSDKLYLIKEGEVLIDKEIKDEANRERNPISFQYSFKNKQRQKIAILGPRETFGESEILQGCIDRVCRAKTLTSSNTFYILDLHQIKFLQDNSEIKDTLVETRQSKSSWRSQRLQVCQNVRQQVANQLPSTAESTMHKQSNTKYQITSQRKQLKEVPRRSRYISSSDCIQNLPLALIHGHKDLSDIHKEQNQNNCSVNDITIRQSRNRNLNQSMDFVSAKTKPKSEGQSLRDSTLHTTINSQKFSQPSSKKSILLENLKFDKAANEELQNPYSVEVPASFIFSKANSGFQKNSEQKKILNLSNLLQQTQPNEIEEKKTSLFKTQQSSPKSIKDIIGQQKRFSVEKCEPKQFFKTFDESKIHSLSPRRNAKYFQISSIQNQSLKDMVDNLDEYENRVTALNELRTILREREIGKDELANNKGNKQMFIFDNPQLETMYNKCAFKHSKYLKNETSKNSDTLFVDLKPIPTKPQEKQQTPTNHHRQLSPDDKEQLKELVKRNTLGDINYMKNQKPVLMSTNIQETMNKQKTRGYRLKAMKQILESCNQISNMNYLNKLTSFITLNRQILSGQQNQQQ